MSKLSGKQLLESSTSLGVLSGIGSASFSYATLSFATYSTLQIDSDKIFTNESDVVNKKYVDSKVLSSFNNKYYVGSSEQVYVPTYSQSFVYGGMKVDGDISIDGQLVILNGDLEISSFGTYSIGASGSISLIEISTIYEIVAGTALSGGGTNSIVTLNVNVDNQTIGVNGSDQLYVIGDFASASTPVYQIGLTPSSGLNLNQDGLYTGITISNTVSDTDHVEVYVNGALQKLGNGVTSSCDCYFGTNVSTAKNYINISAGDGLYWNAIYAGFVLENDDIINIIYNKI